MISVQHFLAALFAVILFFHGGLQSNAVLAAPTTPTTDFTDINDGTATHKTTGLTWKRCAEGQSWSGSTCTGTAQTYTWADATALTGTFAGKSDWRLPTIAELVTIVERDNVNPAVNATIFPGTPAQPIFFSASGYAGDPGYAWVVGFNNGVPDAFAKSDKYYIRLVRSSRRLLDSSGLYTPISDFSDNGDGSITHNKTGLTWKRCAEGQTWTGSTCSGTAASYTWSQAKALASGGWRLPGMNELLSIVEWSKKDNAINATIFPVTGLPAFWSASEQSGDPSLAWYVNFGNGYGDTFFKAGSLQVHLVRGGQPSMVSLSGLNIFCPSTINSGASGSCSATVSYT